MRRFLAALIGTLLLLGWYFPASGADLKIPYKAPAPVVAYDPWTGFYAGVNGGYGFDFSGATVSQAPFFSGAQFATAPQGFTGGVQGGYNFRLGSLFLVGLDADINAGALKGSAAMPGTITGSSELNWFGSVGGRFGVTPFQNLFVYGFGGLAVGDPTNTFTINNFTGGVPCVGQCAVSQSGVKTGPAWGVGMEFALDQHWKLGADWRRYDFGTSNLGVAPVNAAAPIAFDPANRFDVFRVRLNYLF